VNGGLIIGQINFKTLIWYMKHLAFRWYVSFVSRSRWCLCRNLCIICYITWKCRFKYRLKNMYVLVLTWLANMIFSIDLFGLKEAGWCWSHGNTGWLMKYLRH
jgi:hypothetical protein